MGGKTRAPKIFFRQVILLDHGAHGAVDDQNALLRSLGKLC
jgi:hypothetical protein